MKDGWLQRATERSVLVRATLTCIVVGAVLVAINHGDAIVRGDVNPDRLLRIGLTIVVPFVVSVVSSVAALGHERRVNAAESIAAGNDSR